MTVTPRAPIHSFGYASRSLRLCAAAAFLFVLGCSEDDPKGPPLAAPPPAELGIPIEVTTDPSKLAFLDPVVLESVSLNGNDLKVVLRYDGGCKTHSFAAVAGTAIMESYPPQISVWIRHDSGGDRCAASIGKEVHFDVTSAVDFMKSQTGTHDPFYLRILTPDVTEPSRVLIP